MAEETQAPRAPDPADSTNPADTDRGLFDLPDFAAIGEGLASWCRTNPAGAALIAAMLAITGYFYFGVKAFLSLSQSAAEWIAASWNPENDQEHCWAIIPVAVLLVLLRWRDLRAAPIQPSNSGLFFVVAGILAFVAGVRCVEGRYTIFALPLLSYGMVRFLFGKAISRIVLFPCVFLLFMTPIGGVVQGTVPLQTGTAAVIHTLSQFFGIPIRVDGATILSLDGRFEPLEVAGGCSGIRSLMAMVTLAALYAYFVMKTPLRGFLLFGCSLGFAVLGNFARVFSVVLFARFIDPKIATGLYHDYSGFVFFPVAVLAMVGVGNLLNRDWESTFRRWMTESTRPTPAPATGASTAPALPANPTTESTQAAAPETSSSPKQPAQPQTYDY